MKHKYQTKEGNGYVRQWWKVEKVGWSEKERNYHRRGLQCEKARNPQDVGSGPSIIGNIKDQIQNFTDSDNKYVLGIKNAHRDENNKITYGAAFANFFSSPTWKYFESTDHQKVVVHWILHLSRY